MISENQLLSTVKSDHLKTFGQFVLSHCNERYLPDYKKMDLMKIPQCIPYIWAYDLTGEDIDQRFLIKFSGTKIDELHGQNIMGKYDIDFYKDKNLFSEVHQKYLTSVLTGKTSYSERSSNYPRSEEEKLFRYIETLFFPCSNDGENPNFGIGCANIDLIKRDVEDTFTHF